MAQPVSIKCVECNGKLSVPDDKEFLVCEYCGTTSQIQRRSFFLQRPLPLKEESSSPVAIESYSPVRFLGSTIVSVLFGLWPLAVLGFDNVVPNVQSFFSSSRYMPSESRAVLSDITGDRVDDIVVVGKSKKDKEKSLMVFDGATGKRLLKNQVDNMKEYFVYPGKQFFVSDTLGKLEAYDKEGNPMWNESSTVVIGHMCETSSGLIASESAKKMRRGEALSVHSTIPHLRAIVAPIDQCKSLVTSKWRIDLRQKRVETTSAVQKKSQLVKPKLFHNKDSKYPLLAVGRLKSASRAMQIASYGIDDVFWLRPLMPKTPLHAQKAANVVFISAEFVVFVFRTEKKKTYVEVASTTSGKTLWRKQLVSKAEILGATINRVFIKDNDILKGYDSRTGDEIF